MRMTIKDYKLTIITEPKSINFDLPKNVEGFIIKHKKCLAELTKKYGNNWFLSKIKHGNDIKMKTGNTKMITENMKVNEIWS